MSWVPPTSTSATATRSAPISGTSRSSLTAEDPGARSGNRSRPAPYHPAGSQARMIAYLARRLVYMVITLVLVSVVSFVIVQSAPGDFAEIYAARKAAAGAIISQSEIENLRNQLGLDQPLIVQYWRWTSNIVLHNNWGMSWEWKRPVGEVIWERMPLTLAIAFSTLFFM